MSKRRSDQHPEPVVSVNGDRDYAADFSEIGGRLVRISATPGPWGFELLKFTNYDEAWIWSSEGDVLARMPTGFLSHQETSATAALMCAAPRLLRALRDLVDQVESGSLDGLQERLAGAKLAIEAAKDRYPMGRRHVEYAEAPGLPKWLKDMKA